jgi:DNA modification methylase
MNRLFTQMLNGVTCGDCIDVMAHMPARSVDFVLTDPPYLVRYHDRSGRRVINDDNDAWLKPAFAQIHRVLKSDSCASASTAGTRRMCSWPHGARQASASSATSSSARAMRRAPAICPTRMNKPICFAKGFPPFPDRPPPDVIDWHYSGNRLHPTQKPVQSLKPLISAFTKPGGIVLDPFSGSGSTLVAAHELGRQFIGIDLDPDHHRTAADRLHLTVPA